ncbi:MAG: O-antigen ligase family protein [Thiotrichales bacterium]
MSPVTPWIVLALGVILVRPQEFVPFLFGLPVLNLALALATVVWLFTGGKRFDTPQMLIVALLSLVIALSSLVNSGLSGLDHVIKTFFPGVWLFVLIASTARSVRDVRVYWEAIALFGLAIVLHTIQVYHFTVGWTGIEVLVENGVKRGIYVGIFRDPNDLGLFLVSIAPVYIAWWRRSSGLLEFVVHAVLLGLLVYAIYLTNSRGAMIGLGLVGLLALYKQYGRKIAILGSALLPVLIALISVRVTQEFGSDASSVGRLDSWYAGIQMFFTHPVLGVGYDRFVEFNWLTAHNSFILILAEVGILGYVLWTGLLVANMYGLARVFGASRCGEANGVEIAPAPGRRNTRSNASVTAGVSRRQSVGDDASTRVSPRVNEQQAQALGETAFMALAGLMVCAFFLSQSYSIYVFAIQALATAGLGLAIESTSICTQGRCYLAFGKVLLAALASVVVLIMLVWILIRILN